MSWLSDPAFWVSVLAALAAGGSTLYARRQAEEARRTREFTERTMREQADDAKRSAEASQRSATASEDSAKTAQAALSLGHRAWVSIKEIQDAGPHDVVVVIHNTGPTPALECIASIALETSVNLEENSRPAYPGGKRVLGTLGPNAAESIAARPFFTKPRLDERVYLLANIEYLDIFGMRHLATSTYIYVPAENRFSPLGSGIHNSAN